MADRFALFVRDSEECKKQKPITRLVLYALAARANETGYCWPSVEQVMSDTGLCRASVFRALTEVREILTVDAPGYKKSNSYIFPFQEKAAAAIDKSRARNNRARAVAQEGMADRMAIDNTRSRGLADGAAIGQTKKLSTKGKRVVDNSLSQRLGQSHKETGSLSQRPQGSLVETGGGLSQRPEEERGRIQEDLSSLKPPKAVAPRSNVDNSAKAKQKGTDEKAVDCAYDGTTKPKTKAELAKVEFWCKKAGLDDFHTKDFIRVNRLSRWSLLDATTTVCDLIADFVLKWRKDDPEGYYYFNDKRKGIVRG